MSIITAVFVLSFLIFVHELGHFLAAKKAGVGVEKFSIGFGPRIWGVRKGGTDYLLSAVPFGGYVKMVGDNPDEEVTDREKSFLLKPLWKRASIVFAGPASNLLSAVVIVYFVYLAGVPALLPVVGQVQEESPAAAAGLQSGDSIISVGGREVKFWDDLTDVVHDSPGRELRFVISREQQELTFDITPRETVSKNIFGEEVSIGLIGISAGEKFVTVRHGPVESLGMSVQWTWAMIRLTFVGLAKMVQGTVPADNLGGPIMIMQAAGRSAEQGILNLVYFVAYVSVALGLFNLFPIPILDGGHLLFFLIEGVKGTPLSIRTREILQQAGLVLLLALMIYATKNDLGRIFGW